MNKKSMTQMTKKELFDVIKDKNEIIGLLNEKLDQLEHAAIASDARPLSEDDSIIIRSLQETIKTLEDKLNASDQ
jgi:hypothetical protein